MAEQQAGVEKRERRLVWDLPLRLFHWLLAISLGLLWLTQWLGYDRLQDLAFDLGFLSWIELHMWIGYWTIGLIVFRVLWGFVGPRHARFSSFFPWPKSVWAYVRALALGTESKPVGHNPLGSIMVFVMLAMVALQAMSGLFITDTIFFAGPYYDADFVSPGFYAAMNFIHYRLFDLILIAIALHIIAVLFYWIALKQNLVGPMIHGRKPASVVPETEAITSSQLIRALLVIAASAAFVWALLAASPAPPF